MTDQGDQICVLGSYFTRKDRKKGALNDISFPEGSYVGMG